MATSFFSHGLVALGSSMTDSLYHFIWSNGSKLPIPPGQPSSSLPVNRTQAALGDRILSLPGVDDDLLTRVGEQYTGYLTVAPTRHVFYWYIESQGDPANDPVIFWSNGGPGCSGLIGFFTEHGPYRVDADLQLHENPYAWNQMANIFFVEQPAGVGFSIVDAADGHKTSDAQSAVDNYQLIRAFFQRFPERQKNPFYLASESYGGHYIPQLSLEILRRNTEDEINFRGFLLGNPFVDPYSNFIAEVEGMYGHGLLPKPVMEDWRDACAYRDTWTSHDCAKVLETIYRIVEPGFNVYALDFPVCLAAVMRGTSADAHTRRQQHRHLTTVQVVNTTTTVHTAQVQTLVSHSPHNPPYLPNNDQYEPCGQLYMRSYLNQAAVQEAIHVKGSIAWSPCNININYSTADVETPTIDLYKELVRQGQQGLHSLRMLIYSGDDDSVCATDGTQAWLWSLGAAAKDLWRPWKVSGQVAGFWTTFDMNHTNASFGFATVHGAGHEVPSYRPVEALALFRHFIQGDPALIE